MTSTTPILGSMRFGDWGARLAPEAVAALLEDALALGIDTLDLADIYGGHTTNALVGAALAIRPGLRARLKLVAKIGIVMASSPGNPAGVQYYDLSPTHLTSALDASLRDLGVDHVEQLLLHRFDPRIDPDAVVAWARGEQARGSIGGFGVSNFDAQALALFDGRIGLVANQIEVSLAQSAALEDGSHAASRSRGAEVQAWSPLGGGGLADGHGEIGARLQPRLHAIAHELGLSPAAVLLRWVASVPGTRVVLGSTRRERLEEAVRACAEPLPRSLWYALWQEARGRAVA
jgi:predicted oxidoreductase